MKTVIEIDEKKQQVLDASEHILVEGGPGSGKTTIALLKAKQIIENKEYKPFQKVLFLSFARATITRIEEYSNLIIPKSIKQNIDITTYHSFVWTLLKSHGYLLNSIPLRVLAPHDAASKLSLLGNDDSLKILEKRRLLREEGLIHFDLFAESFTELLKGSQRISSLISLSYPVIILDEFQDTSKQEWDFIQELGKRSRLIALADLEQRIFEFRGADPKRVAQFLDAYQPQTFDFGTDNKRSAGTDIVDFGNDILNGKNREKIYKNVICYEYSWGNNSGLIELKTCILSMRKKLVEEGLTDWSIAILVPSNDLMLEVSEYLDNKQQFEKGKTLPKIKHDVAVDATGPSLAATIIAGLIDASSRKKADVNGLIADLKEYILGRKGDSKKPTQADLKTIALLDTYLKDNIAKLVSIKRILYDCTQIVEKCNELLISGNVATDWLAITKIIEESSEKSLKNIASDAKFFKLLHKGSTLNSELGKLWKQNHNFIGAKDVVRNSLTQEHFSNSTKVWKGVCVMTIHKSKGKEFDEVIIYEGPFKGRFVYDASKLDQSRINLRVAVTRARRKAIIFTPKGKNCCLL